MNKDHHGDSRQTDPLSISQFSSIEKKNLHVPNFDLIHQKRTKIPWKKESPSSLSLIAVEREEEMDKGTSNGKEITRDVIS